MRSDYLGACAGFEGFAETVNRCQYLLPRMDDFALLRAIHDPAPLYGGEVAAEVGDRLLVEARREQDPLPVLQHTLMRACRGRATRHGSGEGWTVTAADVARPSEVPTALWPRTPRRCWRLSRRGRERLQAAEWVFRTITDLDAEGRLVRRPRKLGELIEVAGDREGVLAVVEAFRAPGCSFLNSQPPEPADDASEIDISHEALIRRWPRLADDKRDPATGSRLAGCGASSRTALRWRALAVQAAGVRAQPRGDAESGHHEAYENWWPEHAESWAARYAREPRMSCPRISRCHCALAGEQGALAADERGRLEEERRFRHRAQFWRMRPAYCH